MINRYPTMDQRRTSPGRDFSITRNVGQNPRMMKQIRNSNCRQGRIITCRPESIREASRWRFWLWFIFVFIAVGAIFNRLFFLQVSSHEIFTEKAKNQHQYYEELAPKRGEIYLQNKGKTYPAAVNEEKDSLILIPKNIINIESTAETLASIINIPKEEIKSKIEKNREDLYEVLKRKLSDEESLKIREKGLKGVELVPEYWRTYPGSPLASQIIGFIGYKGEEKIGQYGIEGYFDATLKGKGGFLKAEKDTSGRWISIGMRTLEKAEDGDGLILTIDQSVQYFTERKLEEAVQKFEAESGNILIMEPKTGRILAMANYPSYNNEDYSQVKDASLFQNKCIQDQYEPGSIMKPMTYAIALDAGKIQPETMYTDRGSISMSGYTLHNFDGKGRGYIPMTTALDLSLNTGAIFAQQSVGKEKFYEQLKNFGFGETLGIELIGEAKGDIKNLANMKDLNFATAAFGQGVAATPLQMVSAFSAIINGGVLMKPQIVEKVIKNDGEEIEIPPKEIRRVISEVASKKIKAMLVSVAKNGWSIKAAVPGYLIGGKTGTAQLPDPNGGGYSKDLIHSFIAGAPMNDPRFVILVKLDKVKAVEYSSDSSSPIARQVLEFLFDYYNISPTEEATDKEKADYKMHADRLREFLKADNDNLNPQEVNSSNNIRKQLQLDNENENGNQNDNKKSKKNENKNSNLSREEKRALLMSGGGD